MARFRAPFGLFPWLPLGIVITKRSSPAANAATVSAILIPAALAAHHLGPSIDYLYYGRVPGRLAAFSAACLAGLALWGLMLRVIWLQRRDRTRQLEQIGRRLADQQPERFVLTPEPGYVWKKPEAMAAATKPLLAAGFTIAGVFKSTDSEESRYMLLVKPSEALCASVSWLYGPIVCVYSIQKDGTEVSATNLPPVSASPTERAVGGPGLSVAELIRRVLAARDASQALPVTAAETAALFEKSTQREIDWRRERGYSASEVRRLLEVDARTELREFPEAGVIKTIDNGQYHLEEGVMTGRAVLESGEGIWIGLVDRDGVRTLYVGGPDPDSGGRRLERGSPEEGRLLAALRPLAAESAESFAAQLVSAREAD